MACQKFPVQAAFLRLSANLAQSPVGDGIRDMGRSSVRQRQRISGFGRTLGTTRTPMPSRHNRICLPPPHRQRHELDSKAQIAQ
jgi:hypothetical protein